jgi:hypothetical protein
MHQPSRDNIIFQIGPAFEHRPLTSLCQNSSRRIRVFIKFASLETHRIISCCSKKRTTKITDPNDATHQSTHEPDVVYGIRSGATNGRNYRSGTSSSRLSLCQFLWRERSSRSRLGPTRSQYSITKKSEGWPDEIPTRAFAATRSSLPRSNEAADKDQRTPPKTLSQWRLIRAAALTFPLSQLQTFRLCAAGHDHQLYCVEKQVLY